MAITDGAFLLVAVGVLIYFTLWKSEVRIWRIISTVAIMVLGVSMGVIADTAVMYVPSAMCILVGGIKFTEEVQTLSEKK